MFTDPFSFDGRIRRQEYGYSVLITIGCAVFLCTQIAHQQSGTYALGFIPLFWFRYAQGAKRCHDLGNSGFFQLIPLYSFWLLLADGQYHSNEYGPSPKEQERAYYPTANYGQKDLEKEKQG